MEKITEQSRCDFCGAYNGPTRFDLRGENAVELYKVQIPLDRKLILCRACAETVGIEID